MEWIIDFHPQQEYFEVVVTGEFDVDEHVRMVEEVLSHADWAPGRSVLFDRRRNDFNKAAYEEMRRSASVHGERDEAIGPGRAAIVMTPGAAYGLGRQFELLSESNVSATIRIFTDIDEARAWLENS